MTGPRLEMLRTARQGEGLSQRQLAALTGVAQATIARIERGQVDPRVGTLVRLLDACHATLGAEPRPGAGVDRSGFRALLRLTPLERVRLLVRDVDGLRRFERAIRE